MSKKPGVLIGTKGVQYGLQKVAPKKPGQLGPASAVGASAQRKVAPGNVFGDDDSEEEDVERQIARQAEKKRAAAKVQHMYEDALAQDPNAFDYDGVYDSMQEARVIPKQQDKVQRQSKYIASLLDQAQQRKREADVLYERRMVKERQQEDHLYEDKERFVTSAYRRKLEEDKKWQEVEKQRELDEQKNDVRKVGHMGNFYANLLSKNVAYGTAKSGDQDKAKDKETGKGKAESGVEQEEEEEGRDGRGASPSVRRGPEDSGGSGGHGGATARAGSKEHSAIPEGNQPGPSAKVLAQLDQYDMMRLEAERGLREKKKREQGHTDSGAGVGRDSPQQGREVEAGGKQEADQGVDALSAAAGRQVEQAAGGADVAGGVGDAAVLAAAGGQVASTAAAKRRNDDTTVQSARERYLARKQQKMG